MAGDLWVQGGLGRDMGARSNMMHTGNSLNLGNIGGAIRGVLGRDMEACTQTTETLKNNHIGSTFRGH